VTLADPLAYYTVELITGVKSFMGAGLAGLSFILRMPIRVELIK
jgi:hypothetical protein